MDARRIGLFGGTFDPPHLVHLLVAAEVRSALDLDEVVLMVAGDPWQKSATRTVSPAEVRLAMTRAAVAEAGRPWLRVDDVEVRRGGPSYTVETVEAWRSADPSIEVVLVLGADAAGGLDTWHRAEDLSRLVELAVVHRPGATTTVPGPPWRTTVVDVPQMDVSSTVLRERIRQRRATDLLVADGARAIADQAGLYRVAP